MADLAAIGVRTLNATDDAATISTTFAGYLINYNLAFVDGDVVTVTGTASAIGTLIDTMVSRSTSFIDVLDITDSASLDISVTEWRTLTANGVSFGAGDTVIVADTWSGLASLTVSDIASLAAYGVDQLKFTGGTTGFAVDIITAMAENNMSFVQNGTSVLLNDTADNLEALSAADITTLAAVGFSQIMSTDAASFTFAQVNAVETSGLIFYAGSTINMSLSVAEAVDLENSELSDLVATGVDTITIADTAANITTIAGAGIAYVTAFENATIDLTDDAGVFSYATASAILGYEGNDIIKGQGGDDILLGHDGKDTLFGGAGDDTITGNHGDDVLNGGAGDDVLEGSKGDDTLTGGKGADTFVFIKTGDTDTVTDFDVKGADHDFIDVGDYNQLTKFNDLGDLMEQHGKNVIIDLPDSAEIILKNVDLDDLTKDHFQS